MKKAKSCCSHVQAKENTRTEWCIKRNCPPIQPQNRYPSPTRCLNDEDYECFIHNVERANEFLLNAALSDERTKNEVYKQLFSQLQNRVVTVTFKNGKRICGEVKEAQNNYVFFQGKKCETMYIVYEHINTVESMCNVEEVGEKQKTFEPCLRRDLVLHFGETVSQSLELRSLFFGLQLNDVLMKEKNSNVVVFIGAYSVDGKLEEVDKERIVVDGKSIPIQQILFIQL